MRRQLEPEIMDEPEGANAYASADFTGVNAAFVESVLRSMPIEPESKVLDLGCGPADIPIMLAQALPGSSVTAVDASAPMLAYARRAIAAAGLTARVEAVLSTLSELHLDNRYDLVISNSLLHHLSDPSIFWGVVERALGPDGRLYVMDLLRPESTKIAKRLVETHAGHESERLRHDFYHSLLAAFTLEEIRAQLTAAGLDYLEPEQVSDRHWVVFGALRVPQ